MTFYSILLKFKVVRMFQIRLIRDTCCKLVLLLIVRTNMTVNVTWRIVLLDFTGGIFIAFVNDVLSLMSRDYSSFKVY
jgi:hypothetical protein